MPPRRKLVRLAPPHRGIVEGLAYEDHDPGSTVDAQNVRGHDPATGRLRLSQRPGLKNRASSTAPAAQQKSVSQSSVQNISTLTLTEASPHRVGPECVVVNNSGSPQLVDNSLRPPALIADTTEITGEDYQFSVFDRDGNLYVVTIDQTIDGSSNYAKKIRKYARPYTTGVLLSAYNETSKAKDRQVLGYALHGDVLFIWWNGVVEATGEETVTANRISDGARVDNAGSLVPTNSYFLKSPTYFKKANSTAATVDGRVKNLMSSGGGVIGLLGGASGEAGSTMYLFNIYSGESVAEKVVSSGAGLSVHRRLDCCTDIRGNIYTVTQYTVTASGDIVSKLSALTRVGVSWEATSTNLSTAGDNAGKMSSVTVDDWGAETIVYVSGEGMNNSSWTKHDATNDYNVSSADNARHNLVLFDGATGKVINGGSVAAKLQIDTCEDVGSGASARVHIVTASAHNLNDNDRVFIEGVSTSREEANTNNATPHETYVERINDTTLALYKALPFSDANRNDLTNETNIGGTVSGTVQDITEIGITRAYNGIDVYSGNEGGMSFGWNRARSSYAFNTSLLAAVRVLVDKGIKIDGTYVREKLSLTKDIFTTEQASNHDRRAAFHPHAVNIGDSGLFRESREQRIIATAGGKAQYFTPQGGFIGGTSAISELFRSFFSVEYSRFVDDGTLKGPYSLYCDGESYGLISSTPYQFFLNVRWTATAGTLPTDDGNYARLIENWRGRIVLSGIKSDPSNWYMSAYGNPLDWDYFPSVTVETQAVAGNNSSAGKNPDIINSIVPYTDDLLLFGGDKSIWQMTGDPMSGGRLDRVSGGTGMAWGRAWTIAPDGTLFFFGSRGGVYSMVPSQRAPQRLGVGTLDHELTRINLSKNTVFMEWSHKEEGLYLFVCPANLHETPFSYFWDSRSAAWWKDVFPSGIQPSFVTTIDGDEPDDREILIGASNGAIYSLSETAGDDDGEEISSHAFIGPITTGTDGMIAIDEMQYILPTSGNPVSYSIHTGDTVKGAIESSEFFTGNLVAGDNAADRRRIVGKNIFLKVHNKSGEKKPWSLEGVNVFAREIGAAAARTRK